MFISKIQAAGGDRSPYGDFWFEPVSLRTLSGVRVSADNAVQLSAVFRAVQLLSGHIAMLPLDLKKAGTRKRIVKHWLLKLWKKPNRWQNGFEWRQMLMGHLVLRGNAYNEIVDNARGEVVELIPQHPDRVKIEQLPSGDYRYRFSDAAGNERILPRGKVWHLRGLSSNGISGLSVIECARESMGLGLSAQSYGARFFANDARPSAGWIEYPGKFADKEARRIFRESVQDAQSSANRGKMMVLDQGMKYHEVGLNNRDSQFLESRKFQISEIARWFGVPPHKLADLERATFSNIEQQALEYITDSLLIWAEIWEAGIEDVLLFDDEGLEAELNFGKLQRPDSSTRYKNYQVGIQGGFLTRNEAREDDGREPLEGLDEPLRPLNMVEESDAEDEEGQEEQQAEPDQDDPPEDVEPDDDDDKAPAKKKEARLQAMINANAGRMARRIMKDGFARPELIADALAIPLDQAKAWAGTTLWTRETFTLENVTASLIALGSQT